MIDLTHPSYSRCTGTERSSKIKGFVLVGYVNTTYQHLVELFGKPDKPSSDNKVKANWTIESNGLVFTIYDWKTNSIPDGYYDWHIGGLTDKVLKVVNDLIPSGDTQSR